MKHSGHGEGLVYLVTALGFFLLAALLLIAPELVTLHGALGIMAFFLGTKTIANLIMDSHNTWHYRGKKK